MLRAVARAAPAIRAAPAAQVARATQTAAPFAVWGRHGSAFMATKVPGKNSKVLLERFLQQNPKLEVLAPAFGKFTRGEAQEILTDEFVHKFVGHDIDHHVYHAALAAFKNMLNRKVPVSFTSEEREERLEQVLGKGWDVKASLKLGDMPIDEEDTQLLQKNVQRYLEEFSPPFSTPFNTTHAHMHTCIPRAKSERHKVDLILFTVACALSAVKERVWCGREISFVGKTFGTPGSGVEFVICSKSPSWPIVTVVGAKKDSMDDGLQQAAAECIGAHESNMSDHGLDFPVWGVVSMASQWLFLRYAGGSDIKVSKELHVREPEDFIPVARTLAWVVREAVDGADAAAAAAAAEEEEQ